MNIKPALYATAIAIATVILISSRSVSAASGPVLHLNFNESSGSTAFDSSGNAFDGSLVNLPGRVSGIAGNSVSLNGTSAYITVPSNASLQGFTNMTACAWGYLMQFDATDASILVGKQMTAVGTASQDPWTLWEIYVRKDGHPGFAISNGNPGGSQYLVGNGTVALNQWNHICGVYDGSNMNIYVNGAADSASLATNMTIGSNSQPVNVGTFGTTDFPDYWNGSIDDVRIYDRALSASEIQILHDLTAPTISLIGAASISLTVGDVFSDQGATANDAEGNSLSVFSTTDPVGGVNTGVTGTTTVIYTATDSTGISTSTTRVVEIFPAPPVPNTAPSISLNGSATMTLNVGDAFTDPGATSTDAEDGSLTGSIVTTGGPVDTSIAGTTLLTYTVTDSGGLSASTTRTVTVNAAPPTPPAPAPAVSAEEDRHIVNSSGDRRRGLGEVLGAFTTNGEGEVLGASSSCGVYLMKNMQMGIPNDTEDVVKLQALLNEVLGIHLPMTGVFGPMTKGLVEQFQLKYKGDILDPLSNAGLLKNGQPTGVISKLTLWKINMMVCPELQLPVPTL